MHYVIIGNGGAGVSALQTIRGIYDESDITIISQEQYPAYSPCSLPNLIAEEIEKPAIFRFDKEFYDRLNAKFMKNSEVLKIYPDNKEVGLANGSVIKFDKLLIAAGARPIIPTGVKGLALKGVHIMGTLKSAIDILNHVKSGVKHAVVVGGGFMGVETATTLRTRGIKVTIVEMLPKILLRMLDPDISEKIIDILKRRGINLVLNETVKNITGEKKVTGVTINKEKVNCEMVILAIGVKPKTEIIKDSGINFSHGIIVDSKMRTNKKDVFAAGDIAEVTEKIEGKQGSFAIWPNAIEQGRIAGLNMAGKPTEYDGAEMINVLNIFNTPVVAMGRTSKEIERCKIISRFTPQHSKKILLKDNRLVGLQFVGTIRNTGILYSLMKKGADVSHLSERLLDDDFVIAPDFFNSS